MPISEMEETFDSIEKDVIEILLNKSLDLSGKEKEPVLDQKEAETPAG